MLSDDTGIYIREYQSNSEWDIVSTSSKKPSTSHEAGVYMVLTIRRKPMYVIIAVIFPITMLSIWMKRCPCPMFTNVKWCKLFLFLIVYIFKTNLLPNYMWPFVQTNLNDWYLHNVREGSVRRCKHSELYFWHTVRAIKTPPVFAIVLMVLRLLLKQTFQ